MELGPENVNQQAREDVVRKLKSLSEPGTDITIGEINGILGKVGTNIDCYRICPGCASDEKTEKKKVHYVGEKVSPINPSEIPTNLIEHANPTFCPDHRVRFDLPLSKVVLENKVEPVNIAWYVLPEGTKIDLKEANARNEHWKIYDYKYVNTVNGETITKNLQVVFFLDKKQYETQDSRDKVVKSPMGKTLPTKDIQISTAAELMTPKQELLPKGPIRIKSTTATITYEGKDYVLINGAVFMNNMLTYAEKYGYRIDPEDPTKITFGGPEYIAQANMSDEQLRKVANNIEEAFRTIIGIDRAVSQLSSDKRKELMRKTGNNQEREKP
ncbi:MAG: hypothetical protein AAB662_03655 [Patescibacteria group bacterium]